MAGSTPSISRRRVLGAAAALPVLLGGGPLPASAPRTSSAPATPTVPGPSRKLWERRVRRYRRLAAATEEAAETGWFRAANERYGRELEAIRAAFPAFDSAERPAEAEALRAAAWRRMDSAEEAYWDRCTDPMQQAAVALALTPAPDLEAVRDKIGVMRSVQLHELGRMERDCLELIEEDLARLGG